MPKRRAHIWLLLPSMLLLIAFACWKLALPWVGESLSESYARSASLSATSQATHIAQITPDSVNDGIYIGRNDVVEVGLYALDFEEDHLSSGDSVFTGDVVNIGDVRITGIDLAIWLIGSDGSVVDVQFASLPETSLDPGAKMQASVKYVPGANAPILLAETLDIERPIRFHTSNSYGPKLGAKPELEWLASLFPDSRYRATWTRPGSAWADWDVKLSCDRAIFR
jgi:hypothetical protein